MNYFIGAFLIAVGVLGFTYANYLDEPPSQSDLIIEEFQGPDVTMVKQCPTQGDVDSYVFQKGEKLAVLFVNDNFFDGYHFAQRINVTAEEFC